MQILHVRLPSVLKQQIGRVAGEQTRTLSAVVKLALEQYVADHDRKLQPERRAA